VQDVEAVKLEAERAMAAVEELECAGLLNNALLENG